MDNIISRLSLSGAIVISVFLICTTFKNRHADQDIIKVKGSASKDFGSDLIVWSGFFSKNSKNLENAYTLLKKDQDLIREYLLNKGLSDKEIIFSSVEIEKNFDRKYDERGNVISSIFTGYTLKQSVRIESKAIDKIEGISREVTDLIRSGIEFQSSEPQYYYTKLSELKHTMLEEASKDAKERIEKIVEKADGKLGELKNAEMGVFQIIGKNSNEEYTAGGAFNTSNRFKTATITVSLTYQLR